MEKKRSTFFFYVWLTFVSIMLSGWIITVSKYKDHENSILQGQLDSLIYVTNVLHEQDTTYLNVDKYLPTKRVDPKDKFKDIVFIHVLVIGCFMLFLFLFFRCLKRTKIENGEKIGCNLFKIKKKVI